jgi:alkanesulfonate monooxygenase SsuD/methylene tetrahydromethanopterin reductase-like flavin-dependent oxidoreductase (luciferase family)
VKVGIFDHLDSSGGALTGFYEDRLRLAEVYDREGFYCYHVAEHHSTPIGLAPSPSIFLAAMAQRTSRLRLAPLVYLLPFYHPIRLIEEICMIDQLSNGRLEIGTGRGISPVESSFYGIDPLEAAQRYEELLTILKAGLVEDQVTFDGTYYQFAGVPLVLRPVQSPFPAFWYGVHAPESAAKAALRGFNVVTNEGPERSGPVAAAYREQWRRTGATEPMPEIGIVRQLVLADSDARARELAQPAFAKWHENFYHLHRRYSLNAAHPKPPDIDAAVIEGTAIVGSPDTVRAALLGEIRTTGVTYVLGQFAFGSLPLADAVRSVELFARHVMPALRELRDLAD